MHYPRFSWSVFGCPTDREEPETRANHIPNRSEQCRFPPTLRLLLLEIEPSVLESEPTSVHAGIQSAERGPTGDVADPIGEVPRDTLERDLRTTTP